MTDRLALALEAQHTHYRWARDYGKTKGVRITLGEDQLQRLHTRNPALTISEHVRRAVDAYLKEPS